MHVPWRWKFGLVREPFFGVRRNIAVDGPYHRTCYPAAAWPLPDTAPRACRQDEQHNGTGRLELSTAARWGELPVACRRRLL